MLNLLLAAKGVVDAAKQSGQTHLDDDTLRRIDQLYLAILHIGLAENPLPDTPPPQPTRGRPKKGKSRNLVERFLKHQAAVLRFVYDFNVPFDNNLVERDIRMLKVQQKISGCFRSSAGARQFAMLRSFTSSCRKQGLRVWVALGSLFSDDVLYPLPSPV